MRSTLPSTANVDRIDNNCNGVIDELNYHTTLRTASLSGDWTYDCTASGLGIDEGQYDSVEVTSVNIWTLIKLDCGTSNRYFYLTDGSSPFSGTVSTSISKDFYGREITTLESGCHTASNGKTYESVGSIQGGYCNLRLTYYD